MNFVGIDIETQRDDLTSPTGINGSLEPYGNNNDRISVVAFSDPEGKEAHIIESPSVTDIRELFALYNPDETCFVSHNLTFEASWFTSARYDLYKELINFKWVDSMLLLKRWNMMRGLAKFTDRQRYDLKWWVGELYPAFKNYEKDIDFRQPVTPELKKYCALDAVFCSRIVRDLLPNLSYVEQKSCFWEGRQCIEMGFTVNQGITVDEEYLFELSALTTVKLEERLEKVGLPEKVIKSPTKLRSHVYDFMGVKSDVRTKPSIKHPSGQFSTSKKALTIAAREYENGHLKDILKYRQTATELNKFIAGTKKAVYYNRSNIVHPSPRVVATYTGRGSYASQSYRGANAGIALHQYPRDQAMRRMIMAPDGYIIAACDYASQEIRMMAALQKDEFLINLFNNGLDFHSMTASVGLNVDYDSFVAKIKSGDEEADRARFTFKVVGLSSLYRISAATLRDAIETQYGMNLTLDQAMDYRDKFLSTYPGIPAYWDRCIELAAKNLYAETISGRRIHLENVIDDYSQSQTSINFPNQGSCADMKMLAINTIADKVRSMGARIYFELHDCLYFILKDTSDAKSNALELAHDMGNLDYVGAFGWEPPLALPTDCKMGYSWGQLKDAK